MGLEMLPMLMQGGQVLSSLAKPGVSPMDLAQGGLSLGSSLFGQMTPKEEPMMDVPQVSPDNKQYLFTQPRSKGVA